MSDAIYIYVIASILIAVVPAWLVADMLGDWRAVALAFVAYALLWPLFVVGGGICWLVTTIADWHNRRVLDKWAKRTFPGRDFDA